MAKKTKLETANVRRSSDIPNKLCIKDGKLMCKDGSRPDFSLWPDVDVNMIAHADLIDLVDNVYLFHRLGA